MALGVTTFTPRTGCSPYTHTHTCDRCGAVLTKANGEGDDPLALHAEWHARRDADAMEGEGRSLGANTGTGEIGRAHV